MGNEMGNNNTSGLREEDSTTDEAQGKSVQEPINANAVKEENHVVLPTEESKDYHEKMTGLDSDDPKGSGDDDHNQTSDEAEHTVVHPTAESPKAETKPDEEGGGDDEFQQVSFLNELEGLEKSTGSNYKETVLGTYSNQLEKQASFEKEEEEIMSASISVTILPSHDPETQESVDLKFDQHEFIGNHADQSVQDSINSLEPSENILGSSVEDIITKENGHLVETCESDNLDGILVSGCNLDVKKKGGDSSEKEMASQEDKMLSGEKVDVEVGNEFGNKICKSTVMEATTIRSDPQSDHREKCEEQFAREMDCYGNNCSESQPEANLIANSLNSNIELSVPEDKCMVLTEETELTRKESKVEVNMHHYNLSQLTDDSNRESDIDLVNASQTDSFCRPSCKNNEEGSVDVSHDPASNGCCQVEKAKVAENDYHIDLFNSIQSEASEDSCKESEGDAMIVHELGMLPEELSMSNGKGSKGETDCKLEEEKPSEQKIVEEIKKTEAPCANGKGAEEQQSGEQLVSRSLSVEVAYNPQAQASLFQSQDQQQETVTASGDAQGSNEVTLELKPENCEEFLVDKDSTDQGASMNILETSASAVELAMDKPRQEASYYFIAAPEIVRETKSLTFEQCEKLGSTIFPKVGYKEKENVGRLSIESNPDNLNIHVQMRKSPSFDLDLRIEARSEESDQTPLLYQDKTQYNQESLRAMPVEEKVITLERSDSEKSRTPFLGFLKEDEEASVVVTPKKQENNTAAKKTTKDLWNSPTEEVASPLPKGKEKHKRRTSLFGQCMCCATVIN